MRNGYKTKKTNSLGYEKWHITPCPPLELHKTEDKSEFLCVELLPRLLRGLVVLSEMQERFSRCQITCYCTFPNKMVRRGETFFEGWESDLIGFFPKNL